MQNAECRINVPRAARRFIGARAKHTLPKTIATMILLAAVCLSLSACFRMRDITDYSIVSGVYIESASSISLQLVDTSQNEEEFELLSLEGETLLAAVDSLSKHAKSPAYLGSCKTVIFSEKIPPDQQDGLGQQLASRLPNNVIFAEANDNPFDHGANGFELYNSLRSAKSDNPKIKVNKEEIVIE